MDSSVKGLDPVHGAVKETDLEFSELDQDTIKDVGQRIPQPSASFTRPKACLVCAGCLFIFASFLIVQMFTGYVSSPQSSEFVCGQRSCIPFSLTDSAPRILVSGGAGFVGGHLIPRLQSEFPGAHIKIVDNLNRGSKANLLDDGGRARVDFAEDLCIADLTDPSVSDCMTKHADIVFHLADIVAGVDYVFSHQAYVYSQNLRINLNVAESAKRNGVPKFLYTATACSLPKHLQASYENIVALSEQQLYPANPESSYGWSKLMGEYQLNLLKSPTFEVGIVRFHNLYGPRIAYDEHRSQALPSLVRKVLTTTNGDLVVWGSGSQYRDFLYIDDAIDGLMATYHRGLNNGTFQLGTGKATTLRHAAEVTIRLAEKLAAKAATVRFDTSKPEGDRGRIADVSRARDILGWYAQTTFADGMHRMFSWIQSDMGIPVAPLRGHTTQPHRTTSPPTPAPRILVIAYGNHRGGPVAWSSMLQHLVRPYGADLATFRNPASNETNLLISHSKYVWDMDEYDDWADYFRWRTNNSKEFESYAQRGLFGKLAPTPWEFSNTILLAYRHETLHQISTASLQSKYDYFVFTRTDMYYACAHAPEVFSDPGAISVPLPRTEDWGGISDRHTVIPQKFLVPALDLIRPFLESTTYVRTENVEGLTRKRWTENGLLDKVKRFPRTFFIVKRPNDQTRWGTPKKNQPPSVTKLGFVVKYMGEYNATKCPASSKI